MRCSWPQDLLPPPAGRRPPQPTRGRCSRQLPRHATGLRHLCSLFATAAAPRVDCLHGMVADCRHVAAASTPDHHPCLTLRPSPSSPLQPRSRPTAMQACRKPWRRRLALAGAALLLCLGGAATAGAAPAAQQAAAGAAAEEGGPGYSGEMMEGSLAAPHGCCCTSGHAGPSAHVPVRRCCPPISCRSSTS